MMWGLFRYVVASSMIGAVPIACERFAKNRIEWLLHPPEIESARGYLQSYIARNDRHTVVWRASRLGKI